MSWVKDGSGFYYSRYDEPKADEKFQGLNLGQKVYFHKLGDPQSEDQLIHEDPENPKWGFSPEVTEDGKYLVITVWQGTDDRYRVMYKSLEDPDSEIKVLIDNFDHEYTFLGNEGSKFYFKSDNGAPKKCISDYRCRKTGRGKLERHRSRKPKRRWKAPGWLATI